MSDDKKDNIKSGSQEGDFINLRVLGQDGAVVQFKIKKKTPLRKLMHAYCERQNLDSKVARFRFDGDAINETDTPESLKLDEADTIEVYQQQTGGQWRLIMNNKLTSLSNLLQVL